MRNIWSVFAVAVALICAFSGTSSAAGWVEVGDAGSLPGTAQGTGPGPGPLTSISGSISPGNDADMYQIFINNPAAFSATTVGSATFDTQLFLFNASGFGIYANDDSAATLQSTLPAGNVNSPTTTGVYYLAITSFDNDPTSPGGLIFPSTPFNGVFGPTGPGGGSPISGYTGGGGTGTYTITLTGADPSDVAAVPEPTTLALLGSGLVGLVARRRLRRKTAA